MKAIFLRHPELCLAAAGLGAVLLTLGLEAPADSSPWRIVALVAVAVCIFQSLLTWAVRRRQRKRLNAALTAAQVLLTQIVDCHRHADRNAALGAPPAVDLAHLVTEISDTLSDISNDTNRRQRASYPEG